MEAFNIVFTLAMLLTPAVFMLFYRPRRDAGTDGPRVRRLTRQLWAWTGVALAIYAALAGLRLAGATGGWEALPRWMTFGKLPDQLAWLMFFPLWFCLAMRLLVAVRPEAGSPYSPSQTGQPVQRTASLETRRHTSPISARHWLFGWAILTVAAAIVIGMGSHHAAFATLSLVVAAVPLLITPWGIGMSLREPEPMDRNGSEELARAYARHRAAKAWGFFAMAMTMVVLASGGAVALATGSLSGSAGGLIGGILGSVVGVAGAVFGVTMGNQRMRIRRLLDRLNAEQG
ncbi:MAG: hypothetical protein ACYTGZ_08895 [Planctomycetota bacterium]|jgi:hypothetical protein